MLSFADLYEQMDSARKSPLMDSGDDSQAVQLVRAGEQLRKEGENSFWDDFLSLLSNSQGFADLLKVSSDSVVSWGERIRDAREKLGKEDGTSSSEDEEKEVMPTGDNGAVVASNQDPVM